MRHAEVVVGAMLFLAPLSADATHYRYGHLSWTSSGGNAIEATLQGAFRRDDFTCIDLATLGSAACQGLDGLPHVGDIIVEFIGDTQLNWGDGSATVGSPLGPLLYLVTSVDPVDNWFFGSALDPASLPAIDTTLSHSYAATGNYIASSDGCCRISRVDGSDEHINNPDRGYRVETTVNVGIGNSSPVSSLPPIVRCPVNAPCSFLVPAADRDGDPLSFRLSTSTEASTLLGFDQPGPPQAPIAASIDSGSGLFSWNTTGATLARDSANTTLYSAQVTVEDGPSKVAIDFLIQLVEEDPTPPVIEPPPGSPPICETTQVVHVGDTKTLDVTGSDPDPGDLVTLNIAGLPVGANMTPTLPTAGNPVSSSFSWMPDAADVGVHVLNFTASSSGGGFALCPVTIEVLGCEPIAVEVDNSRSLGLFEGVAEEVAGTQVTASVRIEPTEVIRDLLVGRRTIGLWFSIEPLGSTQGALVEVDSSDVAFATTTALGLLPPDGRASYVVSFCGPGEATFRLRFDEQAILTTMAEKFLPISDLGPYLANVRSIVTGLLAIPLVASSMHHYVEAWDLGGKSPKEEIKELKQELHLAVQDLGRMLKDSEQRSAFSAVFARNGIDIAFRETFKKIRTVVKVLPRFIVDVWTSNVLMAIEGDAVITVKARRS